jgi:hypothetical protein
MFSGMLSAKRILLIVSGGIAAYKSLEVIRRLREGGAAVRCILTRAGAEFVTPLSLAALSGDKVYDDLFSLTDEAEMGHIELSRDADLLVVAPASADLLAKMATGQANDLATTALLATDTPILVAPAMNVRMWEHAATQANMALLAERGVFSVGPTEGEMACGEYGFGRLAEPEEIVAAIADFFRASDRLRGVRVLVTSGPTYAPRSPWSPGRPASPIPGASGSCGSNRPRTCWRPAGPPCRSRWRSAPPRSPTGRSSPPRPRSSRRTAICRAWSWRRIPTSWPSCRRPARAARPW